MAEPPQIDDKLVSVAYTKLSFHQSQAAAVAAAGAGGAKPAGATALAAAQWSHQKVPIDTFWNKFILYPRQFKSDIIETLSTLYCPKWHSNLAENTVSLQILDNHVTR